MKRGHFWMAVLVGLFVAGLYVQYHIIGARMDGLLIKLGYTVPDGYPAPWLVMGFGAWFGFFTVLTIDWDAESKYPFEIDEEQPLWLMILSMALGVLYSFGLSFAFGMLDTAAFTWLCGFMDGIALLCIPVRIGSWHLAQVHRANLLKIKRDLNKGKKEQRPNEALS